MDPNEARRKRTPAWLVVLAIVAGCALLWAVLLVFDLQRDAGPRALTLVIDPSMSAADAASKWSTNVGPLDDSRRPFQVEVTRPDDRTTHVTLIKAKQNTHRIEFWFTRDRDNGLRVEGMEGVYGGDGNPLWPLYNMEGSVRLNRSDLAPDPEQPLFLAFDLDGWFAGGDAPHDGFYEIPASALR